MYSIPAYRTAQWVPIVGVVFFLKAILPELIFVLPGFVSHILLDFYLAIREIVTLVWSDYNLLFLTVLLFRYFRLAVNLFAYFFLYQPYEIPEHPTISSDLAHVIIPTAEPTNPDFFRCVLSVLEKRPGWITVVTAHPEQTVRARYVLAGLPVQHHTRIQITTGPMANKRHQIAHVLRRLAANREQNKDVLVVLVDDHVWWPSANFLSAVIAPFEDPKVGIVAMHKRAERVRGDGFSNSLLNFIACLYLERHNFEICASNAIDGSAFVVSGRTSVIRASIGMEDDFLDGYLDEHFFFGKLGPLNPDDDNYITRYIVRNNWDIKWQHQPEALMETALGVAGGYEKFWGQIQRWARSQWRSNPCTVFTDGSVWRRGQIWSAFGHLMSFINFALFWDSLIVYLWCQSSYTGFKPYHLALLILGSKFVKIAPFFWHNPQDLWLFPFSVLFGYFHSFVKLWALLTFYDHRWSGRNLAVIQQTVEYGGDNDDGTDEDEDDDDDEGDESTGDERNARSFSPSPSPSWKRPRSIFAPKHSLSGVTGSPTPVLSSISTPWGYAKASSRHEVPANVREGQYGSRNSHFYGTPRTIPRSSSTLRYDDSTSDTVVLATGCTANDEDSRGRTRSREDTSLSARSPPQTPKQFSSHQTIYTRGADAYNMQPAYEVKTPPRTQYHPRAPDAPRKNSIAFIGANPSPFQDEDVSVRQLELLRGPIGKVPNFVYNRDFPRGDDCQRTHPDASFLSVKRGSTTKRCRSPQPNRYPNIAGRPRM